MSSVAAAAGRRVLADGHPPVEPAALRSVSIATQVLDCFLQHDELGPTQVARELGVAKSTAHHMLTTLVAAGLLDRGASGRCRLSLRLFDYGQRVLDRLPLRRLARPVLVELHESVQEMVQLGLPANGHVVYVERVGNGALGPIVSGEVTRRVPGYLSSAGRAMAAFDPAIERATAAVPHRRHTPFTVTDPARLRRILDGTRVSGWVSSLEESALGVSSVAAPVFRGGDRRQVAGAISIVGPTGRISGPRKQFYVAGVRRAAARVTALLAMVDQS